jgi:hypothetical protein
MSPFVEHIYTYTHQIQYFCQYPKKYLSKCYVCLVGGGGGAGDFVDGGR